MCRTHTYLPPPSATCPQIIPGNNPNHLAYATGVFNGGLYLVNPTTGTATQVIDFGIDAHPHLLAPANANVSDARAVLLKCTQC